jgi:hypothetical protein
VLVRVAFVVLAVFGGSGVLLYLAGWLFLPEEGQTTSAGERFIRDNTAVAVVLAVVLALTVVGPALLWSAWGDGPGFLGAILAVAAVAAVVAVAKRDPGRSAPPAVPQTPTPAPAPAGGAAPTQALPTPPAPPAYPPAAAWNQAPPPAEPPKPPRDRSVLGGLTVGVALIVVGVLVSLGLADLVTVSAVTVLAVALLVVALGLLVGTLVGRSRGLIALGIVLVLLLVPAAAAPRGFGPGDGAGSRSFSPTSTDELREEYRLGAGDLVLDLGQLDLAGTSRSVDVSVGAGQLVVYLPPGVAVTVDASTGVGAIARPGQGDTGGVGVDRSWSSSSTDSGAGLASLELDLEVGLGEIRVLQNLTEVTR